MANEGTPKGSFHAVIESYRPMTKKRVCGCNTRHGFFQKVSYSGGNLDGVSFFRKNQVVGVLNV